MESINNIVQALQEYVDMAFSTSTAIAVIAVYRGYIRLAFGLQKIKDIAQFRTSTNGMARLPAESTKDMVRVIDVNDECT